MSSEGYLIDQFVDVASIEENKDDDIFINFPEDEDSDSDSARDSDSDSDWSVVDSSTESPRVSKDLDEGYGASYSDKSSLPAAAVTDVLFDDEKLGLQAAPKLNLLSECLFELDNRSRQEDTLLNTERRETACPASRKNRKTHFTDCKQLTLVWDKENDSNRLCLVNQTTESSDVQEFPRIDNFQTPEEDDDFDEDPYNKMVELKHSISLIDNYDYCPNIKHIRKWDRYGTRLRRRQRRAVQLEIRWKPFMYHF